jgi:hypothetical protein
MARTRLLAVIACAAALVTWADAAEIRLTTENDFLTNNPTADDLYSFGLALEVEQGPFRVSLRESAFTDRRAGSRFDETYLTVRRAIPGLGAWTLEPELGFVHIGRGLLGQDVQNGFHRLIGSQELDLDYVDSSLHFSFGLDAEGSFHLTHSLAAGPRFEIDSAPGFRSDAIVGAQFRWQATGMLALETLAGAHFSRTSLPVLEPHLAPVAPIVRIAVAVGGVVLSWSYNDYGDRREHLSVGYRIELGPWKREETR